MAALGANAWYKHVRNVHKGEYFHRDIAVPTSEASQLEEQEMDDGDVNQEESGLYAYDQTPDADSDIHLKTASNNLCWVITSTYNFMYYSNMPILKVRREFLLSEDKSWWYLKSSMYTRN